MNLFTEENPPKMSEIKQIPKIGLVDEEQILLDEMNEFNSRLILIIVYH